MSWRLHSSGWTTSAFHLAPSVQMGTTPGPCPELAACFPILIYNSCWIDLCLQFSRQLCPVLPERSNLTISSLPSTPLPFFHFPSLPVNPSKIIQKKRLGCVCTTSYIHQQRGMNCWYTQQCGWTWGAFYSGKKASLKSSHTVWSCFYDVLEMM